MDFARKDTTDTSYRSDIKYRSDFFGALVTTKLSRDIFDDDDDDDDDDDAARTKVRRKLDRKSEKARFSDLLRFFLHLAETNPSLPIIDDDNDDDDHDDNDDDDDDHDDDDNG